LGKTPNGTGDREDDHAGGVASGACNLRWAERPCPRTLPLTPRNKNRSKVFIPLCDGNEDPRRNPPSPPAVPANFHEPTKVIPATLQERTGRHAHETQLQNVDRNAPRRRHAFSLRAGSIQPGLRRNPDRRTAPAATDRRAPGTPRSGVHVD
jgi:hypothetical protein